MIYLLLTLNYLLAFALGGLTAFAELISRYSEPRQILKIGAGWFYIIFNGAIAAFAFLLLHNIKFNFLGNEYVEGGKILIAGTGSMLVLRSSFSSLKINGRVVDIGLAPIIQVFLDAVNKSYDRKRSERDIKQIEPIMKSVNFKKAEMDLAVLCSHFLEALPQEERDKMTQDIKAISKMGIHPYTQSITLGKIIARYAGIELLRNTVETLGPVISDGEPEEPLDRLIEKFE